MKDVHNTNVNSLMNRMPRWTWILILIADGGFIAWGAMAALAPEHLLGPGSTPILTAEYQNFTGLSWPELTSTSPKIADFITILFRMYGTFNVVFGLLAVFITLTAFRRGKRWAWWALLISNTIAFGSAMTFDRVVKAIGILEMTEYLGIAVVYFALSIVARSIFVPQPVLTTANR